MPPSPQADFASALRDLSAHSVAPARFAVYRGNRMAALRESLAASYLAVKRIVGATFFEAMADTFIAAHPPRSPVLHEYGAAFADFADGFEAAGGLPYLGDVARIEWAWLCAYHAEDTAPLPAAALAGRSDDELLQLRLRLHPSASLIRSAHPAGTIWQMNVNDAAPGAIEDWHGQNVLIVRPRLEISLRIVPDETAAFIAALGAGHSLGAAGEAAAQITGDFDLATQLTGALALGLLAGDSPPHLQEARP